MFTAPAESSYRWRTPEQELARKTSSGYLIRCSLQNRAVWGWVCRSAVRSLRPMMAGCGLAQTNPRAPSFSLCCLPALGRLRVLHDKSKPTTFRLIHSSHADDIIDDRIATLRRGPCFVVHPRLPSSGTVYFRLAELGFVPTQSKADAFAQSSLIPSGYRAAARISRSTSRGRRTNPVRCGCSSCGRVRRNRRRTRGHNVPLRPDGRWVVRQESREQAVGP